MLIDEALPPSSIFIPCSPPIPGMGCTQEPTMVGRLAGVTSTFVALTVSATFGVEYRCRISNQNSVNAGLIGICGVN